MNNKKVKTKETSINIRRDINGEYYAVLVSNYRAIWRCSETYKNKADCVRAIEILLDTSKKKTKVI